MNLGNFTIKTYLVIQSILENRWMKRTFVLFFLLSMLEPALAEITDATDKEALTKLKDTILAPKWLKAGEIAAGAIGITMGILKSSAVPFLVGMSTGAVIHFFAANLNSGIAWIN